MTHTESLNSTGVFVIFVFMVLRAETRIQRWDTDARCDGKTGCLDVGELSDIPLFQTLLLSLSTFPELYRDPRSAASVLNSAPDSLPQFFGMYKNWSQPVTHTGFCCKTLSQSKH